MAKGSDTPPKAVSASLTAPEIEKLVLQQSAWGNKAFQEALDAGLDEECFIVPGYRAAFRTFLALHLDGLDINMVNFADRASDADKRAMGGYGGMADLLTRLPIPTLIARNTGELADLRDRRRAYRVMMDSLINLKAGQPLDDVVRPVQQLQTDAPRGTVPGHATAADVLWQLATDIEASSKPGARFAVSTGLPGLDALTGGLNPGYYYVLGARPGEGKTSLALKVLLQAAQDIQESGIAGNALFVTAELEPTRLMQNLVNIAWGVNPASFFGAGAQAPPEAVESYVKASAYLRRLPFSFLEAYGTSVEKVVEYIRLLHRREPLRLIVVDYLQLLRSESLHAQASEVDNVSTVSRAICRVAKLVKAPVLALAQLNRDCARGPERSPKIADLKGSSQIEQDADLVMLLHRPETSLDTSASGQEREKVRGKAWLNIVKNRGGACDSLLLRFDAARTLFRGS
ncbi:MAG: DnaB helicase C-terminal domain-containing protein [Akkermansia sp.]|nr:DnaB helicase C-terminal domain-containing protein [Akkermansia sp.]